MIKIDYDIMWVLFQIMAWHWQAIIWTNDGLAFTDAYMTLGLIELMGHVSRNNMTKTVEHLLSVGDPLLSLQGASPWWPLLGLLARCLIFKSTHCSSFEVDEIYGCPISKWGAETYTTRQGTRIVALSHYCDVLMSAIVSQITSVSIVYSTVCSDADQR